MAQSFKTLKQKMSPTVLARAEEKAEKLLSGRKRLQHEKVSSENVLHPACHAIEYNNEDGQAAPLKRTPTTIGES